MLKERIDQKRGMEMKARKRRVFMEKFSQIQMLSFGHKQQSAAVQLIGQSDLRKETEQFFHREEELNVEMDILWEDSECLEKKLW